MPIKSWRNGTNWTRNLLHFLPNFNHIYWFFTNWNTGWKFGQNEEKLSLAFAFNPFFCWFLVPKIIKFFSTTKNIVVVVVQSNCIYLWVGSGGLENRVHLQPTLMSRPTCWWSKKRRPSPPSGLSHNCTTTTIAWQRKISFTRLTLGLYSVSRMVFYSSI